MLCFMRGVSSTAGSVVAVVVVRVGVPVGVGAVGVSARLAASASAYERRPRGLSASGSGCLAAARDSRASLRGGRRVQQTAAQGWSEGRGEGVSQPLMAVSGLLFVQWIHAPINIVLEADAIIMGWAIWWQ
jgi:hypothetical protein